MNPTAPPCRVLLIEDNQLTRLGLATLLATQPDMTLVGEAADGARGVTAFQTLTPDVTIVDLRLPVMDGVQVTEGIRRLYPEARVLVLTHYDGDENIFRALRAGALGYLTKEAPGEEILDAVRAVAAGRRYLPASIVSQLAARNFFDELTARELQVLARMALGESNRAIALALSISERTATTHASNLMTKLGAKSRTEAVAIGRQRGFLRPA